MEEIQTVVAHRHDTTAEELLEPHRQRLDRRLGLLSQGMPRCSPSPPVAFS